MPTTDVHDIRALTSTGAIPIQTPPARRPAADERRAGTVPPKTEPAPRD